MLYAVLLNGKFKIMDFKIWDKWNKQWLEPMALFFGKENQIWKINACVPNTEPLKDGWYDLNEEDLKQIEFVKGTGLKTTNGLLHEGSIFIFKKHTKHLLDSFIGQVVWMPEYGCFGYIIVEGRNNAFPTAFSEHDELQNDILDHCEIIGSIQEHPKLECVAQHSI